MHKLLLYNRIIVDINYDNIILIRTRANEIKFPNKWENLNKKDSSSLYNIFFLDVQTRKKAIEEIALSPFLPVSGDIGVV